MTREMRIVLVLLMLWGPVFMLACIWPTNVWDAILAVAGIIGGLVFYTVGLINWVSYERSFLGRPVHIIGK